MGIQGYESPLRFLASVGDTSKGVETPSFYKRAQLPKFKYKSSPSIRHVFQEGVPENTHCRDEVWMSEPGILKREDPLPRDGGINIKKNVCGLTIFVAGLCRSQRIQAFPFQEVKQPVSSAEMDSAAHYAK